MRLNKHAIITGLLIGWACALFGQTKLLRADVRGIGTVYVETEDHYTGRAIARSYFKGKPEGKTITPIGVVHYFEAKGWKLYSIQEVSSGPLSQTIIWFKKEENE